MFSFGGMELYKEELSTKKLFITSSERGVISTHMDARGTNTCKRTRVSWGTIIERTFKQFMPSIRFSCFILSQGFGWTTTFWKRVIFKTRLFITRAVWGIFSNPLDTHGTSAQGGVMALCLACTCSKSIADALCSLTRLSPNHLLATMLLKRKLICWQRCYLALDNDTIGCAETVKHGAGAERSSARIWRISSIHLNPLASSPCISRNCRSRSSSHTNLKPMPEWERFSQ